MFEWIRKKYHVVHSIPGEWSIKIKKCQTTVTKTEFKKSKDALDREIELFDENAVDLYKLIF